MTRIRQPAGADRWKLLLACGGALLYLSGCATARGPSEGEALIRGPVQQLDVVPEVFVDTASGAFVLIDLDVNQLRFMNGDQVVWEAPVGTGTGLQLRSDEGEWEFSTPRGVFQVMWKEEMPVWYLPDWWFVQRDRPLPPDNSPERRLPGQLGVAAVYLGEEIAIHGTERPELLGQRVSHGCIRLENRFAQRLYHNVQIGTPVVIIGGEHLDTLPPPQPSDPGSPRPRAAEPLGGVATAEILRRLDGLLAAGDTTGAWVPLASRLITRGLRDDAPALRGLLARAGTAKTDELNWEYATFLADAYSRGTLRAVVSLARIDEDDRTRATRGIVSATMSLYSGSALDERAPWPSRRVPADVLGPEGNLGLQAIAAAEDHYRQTVLVLDSGRADGG